MQGRPSGTGGFPQCVAPPCGYVRNTKKKTKDIALSRQVAIYILKELTDLSYPKIGSIIGKDHSTAVYAVKTVENMMNTDEAFKFNVEGLINDIKGTSN